jgi:large subunit ribosomal protein L29
MKIEEIRAKTEAELDYESEQAKRELFNLRIKASSDSVASPARISELRRTVARIRTIQHERATGIRGQEPR